MECITLVNLLRLPSDNESIEKLKNLVNDATALQEPGRESYFLCHQCRQTITSTADMIEVAGYHQHTFANPEGIIFEIGCFSKAMGCRYIGPATGEFSWFKGFQWNVAVCSRCLIHLGWLYVSSGSESFHGLILDRLIRSREYNELP